MKGMEKDAKFRFLNAMLAAGSPFANDICADASAGMFEAVINGEANMPLEKFAKKILRLYDPDARVEVLDFENSHFDRLFAFASISESAKRLAGYSRGILVVLSLERAGMSLGDRMTPGRKSAYSENMEFIESCLGRYNLPNVEIIFI